MFEILIVAANSGRARFFAYLPASAAEARDAPVLEEIEELTRKARPPTSRPGLARRPGSHAQAYDEHKNQHQKSGDESFARMVLEVAGRLAEKRGAGRMLVAAGPRFLGVLRGHLEAMRTEGLVIDEFGKDLSRLPKAAILAHLDAARMVPQPAAPPAEAGRILRGPRPVIADRS
jgi:protein required for attachment to host cells